MSIGTKRVGLDFNPSGLPEIEMIKGKTAELIDLMEELKNNALAEEIRRGASIAQKEYEEACMWAVKAVATAAQPQDPISLEEDGPALKPQGE